MSKRKTFEEFVDEANKKHCGAFCYHIETYTNTHTKTKITCPIHGDFWMTPKDHLHGQKCKKCSCMESGAKRRMTQQEFIDKLKLIHIEENLDFSESTYVKNNVKTNVKCNRHGYFSMTPNNLLSGKGCPECGKEKKSLKSRKYTTSELIEKLNEIHGDKYDYSQTEYIGYGKKTDIICRKHGKFSAIVSNLLKGHGCAKCAFEKNGKERSVDFQDFVRRAKNIHGDTYEYDECGYVNIKGSVEIRCKKHGIFKQLCEVHLNGCGCPKCGASVSKNEMAIYEYIRGVYDGQIIIRDREVLDNKEEIDILIPELKIGIEYNGLRWHSELYKTDKEYHINKLLKCEERGIRLLSIFEDEYIEHKDIVLEKIRHILKLDSVKEKINGRDCNIKEITSDNAKIFLDKNHIQGFAKSSLYIGCFNGDALIGVMSFLKENNGWDLNRFATDITKRCIGVGGKIFKYFIREYNPVKIKTFADRRWSSCAEENLYTKLGFKLDKILKPDYRYYFPKLDKNRRYHKFLFRKKILNRKYGLPLSMTETEMTNKIGAYKIWDCGLLRYVYDKER